MGPLITRSAVLPGRHDPSVPSRFAKHNLRSRLVRHEAYMRGCAWENRLLSSLFLLGFLAAGYALRKKALSDGAAATWARRLNLWVIRVALPAVVFEKILRLPVFDFSRPETFLPILQPWLHFAICAGIFLGIARSTSFPLPTRACLLLTVGLGNTSFVGLPLLRALLGEASLPTGILQDQLGTFLILATVAAPLAEVLRPGHEIKAPWKSLLRPLRFPPFQTLMVALWLRGQGKTFELPEWLGLLGQTLAPAALLSVGLGLHLRAAESPRIRKALAFGLTLKLAVFPLFYAVTLSLWARHAASAYPGLDPLVVKTVILESSMASMIMAGIVAVENELEPDLGRLMVGLSIPLSLLTVPLWAILL